MFFSADLNIFQLVNSVLKTSSVKNSIQYMSNEGPILSSSWYSLDLPPELSLEEDYEIHGRAQILLGCSGHFNNPILY